MCAETVEGRPPAPDSVTYSRCVHLGTRDPEQEYSPQTTDNLLASLLQFLCYKNSLSMGGHCVHIDNAVAFGLHSEKYGLVRGLTSRV
jgi:hypothetical protein